MTSVDTYELRPGYRISRILKGGWQLAGGHAAIDPAKAIAEMGDYVRAGITTFDCADIYTGVEQLIGDFRRATIAAGNADLLAPLKVHTKFVPDLDKLRAMTRADAQAIIDRSLSRLGLDRLDLVQFHWWDLTVPRYVEVGRWLADMQRAGKIDLVGLTNFNTDCTAELLAAGMPLATTQVQYSLLDLRPEKRLVTYCRQNNIRLLCYGTVAGGFLSERWLGAAKPSQPFENRSLDKYKLIIDDLGGWDFFQALLEALDEVAKRHHVGIADVAMRHVLDRPQVAGIIVGVRHAGHLDAHARVCGLALGPEDRNRIDAVLSNARELGGDVYDLERDRDGPHGRIMKYNLSEAAPA